MLDWEAEVGKPWENPQRYMELSPYFHLKNVKTPTLIVCGEEDWNVPVINSEQLYLSLRRLGVETMLLVYPDQPHEFWRPSYIKDKYLRYAAWFDHYLKGAPTKPRQSKKPLSFTRGNGFGLDIFTTKSQRAQRGFSR